MKKRRHRILIIALAVTFPFAMVFGVLVYIKMYGYKKALIELVESRTNGKYHLDIEKSSVDLSRLSFTFNGVVITRNAAEPEAGIRQVRIPFVQLQFGTAGSLFKINQLAVDNLIIDEPIIDIDAPKKKETTKKETVQLSQQMVRLYPAIESLLSRFDIKSLTIRKGSFGVNHLSDEMLRLSLIDLFVAHWNMQHLTKESQFQLKVSGQELDFGNASLGFSGIEFNFQKHYLEFRNFKFVSRDSLSTSSVTASGRSLKLAKLDYKDLYEHQRYSIRSAAVDSLHVTANFILKKKASKINDRDIISRLLKQSIGECNIDSTIISNASLNLVLRQDDDSVKINLPRVNFKLFEFSVIRDSSTFQVGEIEVGLDRTAIAIRNNLAVNCDKIVFDRNSDLSVLNAEFYDPVKKQRIATCDNLTLNNFNLFEFIFYKEIYADAIRLTNANIHWINRAVSKSSAVRRQQGISDVFVKRIDLQNVNIEYQEKERNFSVSGLSADVTNFKRDSTEDFDYRINRIGFRKGRIRNGNKQFDAKFGSVDFDGQRVRISDGVLKKDSLEIQLSQLHALRETIPGNQVHYARWKDVSFDRLQVNGTITKPVTDTTSASRRRDIKVDALLIRDLKVSLQKGGTAFSCSGEEVSASALSWIAGDFTYGAVKGDFKTVRMNIPQLTAVMGAAKVNYPSHVLINETELTVDGHYIRIPQASIRGVQRHPDGMLLNLLSLHGPSVKRGGVELLSSDSIRISHLGFSGKGKPSIAHVDIFKPDIVLPEKDKRDDDDSEGNERPSPVDLIERFTIHPGRLHFKNGRLVTFGRIDGDFKKYTLSCDLLHTQTDKMTVRISDVRIDNDHLKIDSLHIAPRSEWYRDHHIEDSRIDARLYGVHLDGLSLKRDSKKPPLKHMEATVDRFELDVRRDKRLPDPPETEKPFMLGKLLHFSDDISLKTITLSRGKIVYTETSEKTGEDGIVELDDLSAKVSLEDKGYPFHAVVVDAETKLYNAGKIHLTYETLDSTSFLMKASVKDIDLRRVNRIVKPLQGIEIKSGYLKQYTINVVANREVATGTAVITYEDLKLQLFKKGEYERRTVGTEFLTFLANDLFIKRARKNAVASVSQTRIKHKSIFNYWVKSTLNGAIGAVRKGKNRKVKTL